MTHFVETSQAHTQAGVGLMHAFSVFFESQMQDGESVSPAGAVVAGWLTRSRWIPVAPEDEQFVPTKYALEAAVSDAASDTGRMLSVCLSVCLSV
ncbi:hypothetical protein P43SY_011343 [Pythium insidiosum]|uniref:Uncharacterized protein n=1 Tax=Pythium insidiosum TaxID=114742 RepID=A0AAD5Q248_PYTIN|nr:hypothetical protein P43SY_011343 [Pythium insidiosum]